MHCRPRVGIYADLPTCRRRGVAGGALLVVVHRALRTREPARLERTRIVLAEILGIDGVEESLREWPSGAYGSLPAFEALERFAMTREVLVWADHIEAPRVTPRHPIDVGRFLWGARELHQRQRNVRILVSGREGISCRRRLNAPHPWPVEN